MEDGSFEGILSFSKEADRFGALPSKDLRFLSSVIRIGCFLLFLLELLQLERIGSSKKKGRRGGKRSVASRDDAPSISTDSFVVKHESSRCYLSLDLLFRFLFLLRRILHKNVTLHGRW